METLYRAGLSNALSATALALLVACLGRVLVASAGRDALSLAARALKLITPPLFEVPIPWISEFAASEPGAPESSSCRSSPTWLSSPWPCQVEARCSTRSSFGADWRLKMQGSANRPWPPIMARPAPSSCKSSRSTGGGLASSSGSRASRRRSWYQPGASLGFRFSCARPSPWPKRLQERVDELADELGRLHAPLRSGGSAATLSPMVWAVGWRPRLLIFRSISGKASTSASARP